MLIFKMPRVIDCQTDDLLTQMDDEIVLICLSSATVFHNGLLSYLYVELANSNLENQYTRGKKSPSFC